MIKFERLVHYSIFRCVNQVFFSFAKIWIAILFTSCYNNGRKKEKERRK